MKERTNTIRIVGTLVENKLREDVAKNGKSAGKTYISGEIIIKCNLDGADELFPVHLYAFDVKQDGTPNKLFASYKNIANLVNRRIVVTGYFSERRFYSAKTAKIAAEQRLNGRFVSEAPIAETADSATFSFSGYVASKLESKTRKDETAPYLYEIYFGQENNKATASSIFHFHVAPNRTDIINSINKLYTVGQTVKFAGDLRFVTQKIVKEEKAPAFGQPTAHAFTVTNKYYYITSGDAPITGETAYTMDEMKHYHDIRVENDIELQSAGKSAAAQSAAPAASDSDDEVTENQVASLI
jgi:hypothetical protein